MGCMCSSSIFQWYVTGPVLRNGDDDDINSRKADICEVVPDYNAIIKKKKKRKKMMMMICLKNPKQRTSMHK